MVFLVRKLRTLPGFGSWQVVVVTDRRDLEKQLAATAALTGENPVRTRTSERLIQRLRSGGGGLLFAMIQKYLTSDEDADEVQVGDRSVSLEQEAFPLCSTSADILVLVDEAHRTHSSVLHANMRAALPNAAMVAFTGTPILHGRARRTHEIFGPMLDEYNIKQAEEDGATVPILYEGRETEVRLNAPDALDNAMRRAYPDATEAQLEEAQKRYTTSTAVLEAQELIDAKAEDMLGHYLTTVLPGGFKAQVVAATRRAAVRYAAALQASRDSILSDLDARGAEVDQLLAADPIVWPDAMPSWRPQLGTVPFSSGSSSAR